MVHSSDVNSAVIDLPSFRPWNVRNLSKALSDTQTGYPSFMVRVGCAEAGADNRKTKNTAATAVMPDTMPLAGVSILSTLRNDDSTVIPESTRPAVHRQERRNAAG